MSQFAPTAATSIVLSMSETRRSRGNSSVPEMSSRRSLHNFPVRVYCLSCPRLLACEGSRTRHRLAELQFAMHRRARPRRCKTLRMTRSSMYTSPIVLERGRGESSEQQATFVQCTSSEKLSAVSTLERVFSIDISHDDRGHADQEVAFLKDGFDGGTRFRKILRNQTFDLIDTYQIPAFVIQIFEPTSGDARSDQLFRHARSKNFVQVETMPVCLEWNLYRL